MKSFEVEVRIRNNRLKQRRVELGMTSAELSRAAGISPSTYSALETMRKSPVYVGDSVGSDRGDWVPTALKLAAFHGVEPSDLFPDEVLAVEKTVAVQTMDYNEIARLSGYDEGALSLPEKIDLDRTRRLVREKLVWLAEENPRHAKVLALRLGFDCCGGDGDEHTLAECGDAVNVSSERARQMEARVVRMFMHPARGLAKPTGTWGPCEPIDDISFS